MNLNRPLSTFPKPSTASIFSLLFLLVLVIVVLWVNAKLNDVLQHEDAYKKTVPKIEKK